MPIHIPKATAEKDTKLPQFQHQSPKQLPLDDTDQESASDTETPADDDSVIDQGDFDSLLDSNSESLETEEDFSVDSLSGEPELADADGTPRKSPITKSLFPNGKDTLYFPREGESVGALPKAISKLLRWKINGGAPRVVRQALLAAGFKFVTGGDKWLAYWGKHLPVEKFKKYHPWQMLNHFPYSFEVGRKDKMWLNYCALVSRHGDKLINYVPDTYLLPRNRVNLDRVFYSSPAWILKPPASARGIGIRVITKPTSLPKKRKESICSRYIANPLLIDNRKFDLRIYVLVTGFEPLRIYVYQHGLARFASEPYSKLSSSKKSSYRYSHLTNYSINKKNIKPDDDSAHTAFGPESPFHMKDNKWSLETLRDYFKKSGMDFGPVQAQVNSIIVKAIMSVQTQNVSGSRTYKTGCFELFGFDILLDASLKAWLMEVNISPALKGSCDMDYKLKSGLIVDLFNLVGITTEAIEQCRNHIKKGSDPVPFRTVASKVDRDKHRAVLHDRLPVLDNLTDTDFRVLAQAEDELARKGAFVRLWPSREMADHLVFLPSYNYYDRLLLEWTLSLPTARLRVQHLLQKMQLHAQKGVAKEAFRQPINQKILNRMAQSGASSLGGSKASTLANTSASSSCTSIYTPARPSQITTALAALQLRTSKLGQLKPPLRPLHHANSTKM
ncbi:Tubulin polyglutamylase ttll4 [Kappamyces sp. JEL0829]|nr:Tubulin polyglutamylase ttll4 [Kappamyces sp. JEL0829]